MLVGNRIDFLLKEGSSPEDQGTGLCIVDLKLEYENCWITLMSSISLEVPSNATCGKLRISRKKS